METFFQIVINAIIAGTNCGLVALSFALIYNTTHFFHFAHGISYTAAAYTAFSIIHIFKLGIVPAICGGLIVSALLGGAMELCIYREMRIRNASRIALLLASLGLSIALQNCISMVFGDDIKVIPLKSNSIIQLATTRITTIQLAAILVSVGFYTVMTLIFRFSRIGRIIRAVANNQSLSQVVGINSSRVILCVFIIASGLVGAAGVIASMDTGLRPSMGFNALLVGVVGMVIGGVGKFQNAFLGGIAVGGIQQSAAWILSSKWQDAIVFATLTVVLLIIPRQFFIRQGETTKV
jgi:branched-chain amino acid transport system permease protein